MENKIKQIELEVNSLISIRQIYFNIVVIVYGGCIGLLFTDLNILKISLFVIGFILNLLFISVIINCNNCIKDKIKGLQ